MRPIWPSPFMICLIGLAPLLLLAVLATWWMIKKAGGPKTLREQNLQNNVEHQLADTPGNHGLAITSIILGILGFVLPCLSLYLIYFPLHDYIRSKIGADAFDYLLLFIPMILWIAGPLSITAGIQYLKKDRNNDVLRSWRTIAKIGIGLGTLTIPVVLCPLLLLLGIFYECTIHHGC